MGQRMQVGALGVAVTIELGDVSPTLAAAVEAAWRDAAHDVADGAESLGDAPGLVVRVDEGPIDHVLETLSQRVTLAAIDARRGECWMLHAAGLALPDGRVVALIGPSGRGKTTASRELGRAFGYVTDETVMVDDEGTVWPYRKPLSIIEETGRPKVQRASSDVGLLPLPDAPLRLAAIVLLDRRADAPDEPRIEPVPLGEALEELVAQSSYLARMPTALQAVARHVSAVGGVSRVVYREAPSLASLLPSLAVHPAVVRNAPISLPELLRNDAPHIPDRAYHRGDVLDAIALDGGDIAVLSLDAAGAGTVRVLSGIGPTVYGAASGATLEQIVDRVTDVHGAPPVGDATDLVRAALDGLMEAGIVELRPGKWAIRDDVAWTEGDRYVALALSTDEMTPRALEGSAALVWGAVAEGPDVEGGIVDRVADAAGHPADIVGGDVSRFLRELRAEKLLELR